ncbi:MAG TPA: hypothetical protein VFF19_17085 [Reyranella sp.]|jgi:hypothetical protein|nr:hypothetical protein [Reyranella sp.]
MKRGILVATLMMTAAGVASANLLTTAPQGVASPWPQPQRAADVTRPVTTVGPEKSVAAPALAAPIAASLTRKGEPAPTVQKASVETRQAPVPFQPKPRPPVNLPPVADKDKATEAKASGQAGDKPSDTGSDPAGEKAARAAIEADGYKGVTVLRKGANGVWHASALRGKTTVMLTVDASGGVSAD